MNNAVKNIIVLQALLLVGCGSQNLVIDTYIPSPLVNKNEIISARLVFDEKLQNFIFSPEKVQRNEASIEINFGSSQVRLFQNVFSSFFSLVGIESGDSESTKIIHIDISLDKFEYLTPQMAANQKYSVWFKYNIQILDDKNQSIDNWYITGYGEQETGSFQADEAFTRAIQIALRDTGANLSIKMQDDIKDIVNSIS